jgi:hypothetical protein
MPPFPKPNFPYTYSLGPQIKALNKHRTTRQVPDKVQNRLLILTWNIANLGQQERTDDDLAIIAHNTLTPVPFPGTGEGEPLSWFDVIAVQECKENFGHLFDLQKKLGPSKYQVLCSDAAGNNERMTFIYDKTKITPLEEIGEIAFPPSGRQGGRFQILRTTMTRLVSGNLPTCRLAALPSEPPSAGDPGR